MVTKLQIELAVEQSVGETKINSFGLEGKATLWEKGEGERWGNELAADGTSVWILASGLADLPSNISDPSSSNILPSAACLVVIKRIALGRQPRLGILATTTTEFYVYSDYKYRVYLLENFHENLPYSRLPTVAMMVST